LKDAEIVKDLVIYLLMLTKDIMESLLESKAVSALITLTQWSGWRWRPRRLFNNYFLL